jgi:RNA polymerase sigma-70 factor (ECF subfamily)
VPEQGRLARFEETIIPHLNAAYNLARWLSRNDYDAEDLVQEAYLRAYRYFDGFRGGNSRAWLLKIVRNTFYTSTQQHAREPSLSFDDEIEDIACDDCDPELMVLAGADHELLRGALEGLPVEYREAIVLRDLEGLSYKEIAAVAGVPLGTVMSRLARGRQHLQLRLAGEAQREVRGEL